MLALYADLIYLIDRLSKEISWMAKNKMLNISMNAKKDASATSVKNELTNRNIEQAI
jgi:transcriptional/translational regulatory protein YebC/TACO1